jgi:heme-degrading monooxygenase HmoA
VLRRHLLYPLSYGRWDVTVLDGLLSRAGAGYRSVGAVLVACGARPDVSEQRWLVDEVAGDGVVDVGESRDQLCHDVAMILEHAVLDVLPDREHDFESAFAEARPLIECQQGFRSLRLDRCLESPSRYLLLVEWDNVSDHTVGFRTSPEYARWSALLHRFYDPFPTVEHYGPAAPSS